MCQVLATRFARDCETMEAYQFSLCYVGNCGDVGKFHKIRTPAERPGPARLPYINIVGNKT